MLHIIHSINKKSADEFTKREHAGFLMSNKRGNFLSLGDKNITQAQGLFFFDNKNCELYKTIESLDIGKPVSGIKNNFFNIKRSYDGKTEETFNLFNNSLLYQVNNYEGNIVLNLDFREMFDFDDRGRIYSVEEEDGLIIIKYEKFTDDSLSELKTTKYLVINGANDFQKIGQWEKRIYPYDGARGSRSEFYVYKALSIKVNQNIVLTMSFSENKEEAMMHSKKIMLNKDYFVNSLKNYVSHTYTSDHVALNAAMKALDDLLVSVDREERSVGIFAGFPWFYQFWSRDELISLKALMIQEKYYLAKSIMFKYLDLIADDGLIPNRIPYSSINSSGSIEWLFLRLKEYLDILSSKKLLNDYLSVSDLIKIKTKLEQTIQATLHYRLREGLVYSKIQETWMDTVKANRSGACIETQALFLSIIKLHNQIAKITKTKQIFKSFEKELKEIVRKNFFNPKEGTLLDTFGGENHVRPNIFLACYVYPDLLSKNEWKLVFDNSLKELWLGWGGLSSIGHKDHLFRSEYTGENNDSYHNGDSWFFVNNLAAITMGRIDPKYYADKIDKILKASTEDLLFNGFVGCCSELSSAKNLKSEGCLSQAWSAATFIELYHELNENKN